MAGTVMHLVIADRLLEQLKIENVSLFFNGNLAPDAIMARKNYEREMKRHTHFKDGTKLHDFRKPENREAYANRLQDFYNRYVRYYTPERDLYLGYITHMLVDELYILEFRDGYVDRLLEKGKAPDDKEFFDKYTSDVDLVDWELVRSYPFHYPMPDILYCESTYEIQDWITNEELLESKKFIVNKNFEKKHEKKSFQVLSMEENLAFIEMCVKRIPEMLMQLEKRPKLHFTPRKGWINDPNGLIKIGEKYHLFYQHYPEDTKWGPMHWGHAVSENLLEWENLPIALMPTEKEYIFSGSAMLDEGNISCLGVGKAPLLLFYTSHNPLTGEQMQGIAYSQDYVHFEKYEGNPVISNSIHSNRYKKDFRDPKVFVNKVKGGYGMVLAVNDAIKFYASPNFLEWHFTGAFYPGNYGYAGLCECPDFYSIECDGEEKYILSMSMIYREEDAEEESHVMQYFVGDFDGDCFCNTQPFEKQQLLDFGKDNYACVSFANSDRPLMMGWGEDWNEARRNHQYYYFGKMTLVREVELCKVNGKMRLRQTPVLEEFVNSKDVWQQKFTLEVGETLSLTREGTQTKEEMQTQSVTEYAREKILVLRNHGREIEINGKRILREIQGKCLAYIIYDCGYMEIFLDEGLIAYSENVKCIVEQ